MTGNQVNSSMFDVKSSYSHGQELCHFGMRGLKTLGYCPLLVFSTQVAMEWLYGHIDPLCNWSWLCFDSVANPLCMSSWLRLVLAFKYRSTLYFSGYTLLIIVIMDPHCVGWRPCLSQFLSWAWDMPASVLILSYIVVGCRFCSSALVLLPYCPNHHLVKCFGHHIVLWSHTLGDNMLHLKFPRLSVIN